MKKFRFLLFFGAIPFWLSNCIVIADTTPTYVSEGSLSSPISLDYNTTHYGEVDGVNSSFYVYYGVSFTKYYIDLTNQTGDSDLLVYVDDSSFSTPTTSSKTSGTASEYCTVYSYQNLFGNIYIEVYPYSAGNYDLVIY